MPPTLRLATPDDAGQVIAVYAPYCATPISFEAVPPSVEDMRQRLVKILEYNPWLVCEDGNEVLGYAYAGPHRERAAYRWSVDTSVYVLGRCRRLGVGRALYTALFQALRLQGYVNAYAGATLPNPASVGLHKAMGFELVGIYRQVGYKYGVWHDVGWFQLQLQPRRTEPAPPKPLSEIAPMAGWRAALDAGISLLKI